MSLLKRTKSVATVDATWTAIDVFTLEDVHTYYIKVKVIAYCTGGAGGFAGSVAAYETWVAYKRAGAGPVIVGAVHPVMLEEDAAIAAAWGITFAIVGNTIELRVTGGATDNVSWSSFCEVMELE